MKGKDNFSSSEISELRSLIKERIKADKARQKVIRAQMRKIGFYGSYDFGITDLQPSDFESLISSGRIKVPGHKTLQETGLIKQTIKKTQNIAATQNSGKNFILFDPVNNSPSHLPDNPGNYIICLNHSSVLPEIGVKYEMKAFQGLNVIYTGIASISLRKRDYKQHFTGNNAGSSTLRKSLGSMFGYPKIARDKYLNNGKTKFTKGDEIKLSEWMQSNLVLYFKSNLNPSDLEDTLIKELNPPLNLSKNRNSANQEFRNRLSELRVKK